MPSTPNLLVNLGLYFAINLSLSTCNKLVLEEFPYPWLLTTLHATFTSIGCLVLLQVRYFKLSDLTTKENIVITLFSSLFTVNIAISNASLSLVSLPFHQVMRSTTPIFTVLVYRYVYSKTYTNAIYASLVAMSMGIGLATYGDYYITVPGFCLTAMGVVLASVKTITSNGLMTGSLKLHPLDILLRMSPLAALQSLTCSVLTGEFDEALTTYTSLNGAVTCNTTYLVLFNGFLAFFQNISSFHTNKIAGALTVTVCANLKQSFTIIVAAAVFHLHISFLNGIGMTTALGGSAWYSWIQLVEKRKASALPP